MENNNLPDNKSRKKWFYVLLCIIACLVYFLISKQIKQKKQDVIRIQYIEEKNSLRDDLDDLIDEHDNLLDEYGNLNNQLSDKDSIIQDQISEIRYLIRTKKDLSEAKRKIALLKDISKRYLSNIDSLLVLNETLITEKDSVIKVNRNINWRNYKLYKENIALTDKVNKGSALEIGEIIVKALKYRNSGKEVETKKASKTMMIRADFEIQHNLLAEKGPREIYIRYLVFKGNILLNTINDQFFNTGEGEKEYSVAKKVQYDNRLLPVSIDFQRRDQLTKGDYIIEIYIDGLLLGEKILYLK